MSESKQFNAEDSITVLSGTDPPMILPIENSTLTLECLTTYFPNANGLVWTYQTGRCHGLEINNGQMSIIPQIRTYTFNKEVVMLVTLAAVAVTQTNPQAL